MLRISESLIKLYLSCPKKAFYYQNLPGEIIITNKAAIGIAVHKVLETSWRNSKEALAELEIQLQKNNIRTGKETAYKSIANFFKMFHELVGEDDVIEKYFKIPIGDGVFITGRLDRISHDIVIDWKTGDLEPEDIKRDVQCLMYYLAYRKLYKKEPAGVYLVFLAKNKILSFLPEQPYIDEFENHIIPFVVNGIKQGQFPRTGLFGYRICRNCPYQNICFQDLGVD